MTEKDLQNTDMDTGDRETDKINFNVPVKSDEKLPDKDLQFTIMAVYDSHESTDGGNPSSIVQKKNALLESTGDDDSGEISGVCRKLGELSTRSCSSTDTNSSSEDDERPECDMNERDLEKRYQNGKSTKSVVTKRPQIRILLRGDGDDDDELRDTSISDSFCDESCACDEHCPPNSDCSSSSISRSEDSSSRSENDVNEYEESEDESATLYSSYSSPRFVSPTCDGDFSDDSSEISGSSSGGDDDTSDDDDDDIDEENGRQQGHRGNESDTDTEDSDSSSDSSCDDICHCSTNIHGAPSITEDYPYGTCYFCGSTLYDRDPYEKTCSISSSTSGSSSTSICTSPEMARYVSFESLINADDRYILGSDAATIYSEDDDVQLTSTMSESSSDDTEDSAIIVCNCCECYRDCLVGGGSSEVEDHRLSLVDASTSTDDLQDSRGDASVDPEPNNRQLQVMYVSVYVVFRN